MTYRTFEHTADIGLEVEAANLDRAFAEAALGCPRPSPAATSPSRCALRPPAPGEAD